MFILIAHYSSSLPVRVTFSHEPATPIPPKRYTAYLQQNSIQQMSLNRRKEMEVVQEKLRIEAALFCDKYVSPSVPIDYFNILHARLEEGAPLRGYFVEVFKRYVQGEGAAIRLHERFMGIQLPFVLEVLITILYYDNQIYDKKFGVIDNQSIAENLIKRNKLYDSLLKYIRKDVENKDVAEDLTDFVQEMHEMVNTGQEWERKYNHYDSWTGNKMNNESINFFEASDRKINNSVIEEVKKTIIQVHPIPIEKSMFFDAYLSRIYLTNASLFAKTAAFILRYSSLNCESKEKLQHFSEVFGMILQIVNDNGDFVPASEELTTSSKISADALSDLRNMNITLPISLHLIRKKESKIKAFLDSGGLESAYVSGEVYSDEIAESHAIYYAMKIGKKLEKQVLLLLNAQNPAFENFKDMASVAQNNKYYRYFYGLKEQYKGYQKSKTSPS